MSESSVKMNLHRFIALLTTDVRALQEQDAMLGLILKTASSTTDCDLIQMYGHKWLRGLVGRKIASGVTGLSFPSPCGNRTPSLGYFVFIPYQLGFTPVPLTVSY